jgi:hypothetical protein|tara:strand:- start:3588 stop:4340 length:753 start_codon:yes stop_codon:yes gene_type:complete
VSTLITNVPPLKVWVRKEYLRDLRDGHGEYALGYTVSIKSLPGRVFYWEVFLPEYGALFDKLPISALLLWDSDSPHECQPPVPDLPLEELQFWNCFSHDITTLEKNLVYTMGWQIRTKTHGSIPGEYLFTIDSFNGDRSRTDISFAETPDEHKSFNIIALPNGQIAAYPNNRCLLSDPSLSPEELKQPDFLVSTRYFQVESPNAKWGRLGEAEEYFWETKSEQQSSSTYITTTGIDINLLTFNDDEIYDR